MNSYEKIYNMIIETNFPGDTQSKKFQAAISGGRSLLGPKLKASGEKHAERLERTKKTGSSLLAQYLSRVVGHSISDLRKPEGEDS